MASDVVADAIEAYLSANWAATPISFENQPFSRPASDNGAAAPFIALEITGTLYAQQSIGESAQAANRWDEEGQLWLHVYVQTDTGSSIARRYAKQLADLFRGLRLVGDNLEFMDASIGMGQPGDDDGVYWSVSVEIDWRRFDA